ncbi:pirin family protein [Fulvivirgaceae bacterium BMA12]|uniref:Pirin family protein n=1 Tax=Agaribacillus aureus TaxID=3051825 RepID=A0ABT8L513_9BACT|nr:pirin family protein [Fulvivirgaceae bacterium BMA12]
MALTIYTKNEQATGEFAAGAIKENKPLGFPQEGGSLRPFSSLFYWAHAWSDKGGLIGEHPHQGFEIMSFVLEGEIEHYDSQLRGWKRLSKGDVQIIRSGKGITHAERFLPGAHIFQIWVDPDLKKTLQKPASYNDYGSGSFPETDHGGYTTRLLKGDGAPLTMDAQVDSIKEINFNTGLHSLELNSENVQGLYVIEGALKINGNDMGQDDFVLINGETQISIDVENTTRVFIIDLPVHPGYETYAEMQGISTLI